MTPDDVRAIVASIEANKRDDEAAHYAEDGLHRDVLRAIAIGECDEPAACAALALSTEDIRFSRWYA